MNSPSVNEAQRQRSSLFDLLKRVVKTRGLTYADLAQMLAVSEPTVKRLFQEQDCKISRLVEVCDALGMTVADLVDMGERENSSSTMLSEEVEAALASRHGLLSFFMLLISHFSVDVICELNGLTKADAYRYLRALERLDLIQLGRADEVHFKVVRPIRWRLNGPLHDTLVGVNQRFIGQAIDEHNALQFPFYSSSRLLSEVSIQRLNTQLDDLYEAYQKQATLDQLHFPVSQLKPFKMVGTIAPFNISLYFKVPPFDQDTQKPLRRS